MNQKPWQRPELTTLDTVVAVTGNLDKIGSSFDYITETIPDLDGNIQPD
jgi:hypothetical protein